MARSRAGPDLEGSRGPWPRAPTSRAPTKIIIYMISPVRWSFMWSTAPMNSYDNPSSMLAPSPHQQNPALAPGWLASTCDRVCWPTTTRLERKPQLFEYTNQCEYGHRVAVLGVVLHRADESYRDLISAFSSSERPRCDCHVKFTTRLHHTEHTKHLLKSCFIYYSVPYIRTRGVMKWRPVSACPSVCRVPRPNSRTERPRKSKIGRMEAHHTGNSWTYLEVKDQGHQAD